MLDIRYTSAEELLRNHLLASSDFDLLSFIPSNLSAEENRKAQDVLGDYCQLSTDHIGAFCDLRDEKEKVNKEISAAEKKLKPGCITNILLLLASYLIAGFVSAMVTIVLFLVFSPATSSGEVFFGLTVVLLFILAWIFFAIKLRKWISSKEEQKRLAQLKQKLASIQAQMETTRKNLAYAADVSEEDIYNDICEELINFSETVSLLEKQAVILNDSTLSPSASLLAMEQLYATLRQEKHNKAMEAAAYNSAERIAAEMAEQETANRILDAFLTGYLSSRNK